MDTRFVGQRIGSYTIKQPIAEGGMGAVYLAEQESPRREVALKIMTAGFWSRSAQRRFQFETEVLGRLHHPNIPQVYEAGIAPPLPVGEGRREGQPLAPVPFFAMEYIPGAQPITAYCDKHQLDQGARLQLFLQICEAVHYGHQKGVIHRDLKPANLLIDEGGHAKVIDFGITRTTDSDIAVTTMHTEAGQLLGTLAYMSPEQCAADPSRIDTTTDIYSLGVILFELLTGRMPYDVSNMTIQSAARVICEKEPARPSGFNRRLRGDVETLIFKAIEKKPALRYTTVNEFAEDIRRVFHGEPIAARPPTAYSRALRWMAKHPTKPTALSCLSVVALIAVATTVLLYFLGRRPDRIELAADGSDVRLLTVSKHILHRWEAGKGRSIPFAELVRQPKQFDARRLAVIAFSDLNRTNASSLCAFDIDGGWDRPVWQKRLAKDDFPDKVVAMGPKDWSFSPRHGIVADIFPELQSPGLEIAITFQHNRSRCALCIYDTNGTLLYRIWQDGGIGPIHWLAKKRLLVCVGAEENVKDHLQEHRVTLGPILFALRPELGFKSRDYIRESPGDDPLSPIWYRYVYPPFSVALGGSPQTGSEVGALDRDRYFRLCLTFLRENPKCFGEVSMIVDENGDELPMSKTPGDFYNANRDQLPGLDLFGLRDAPPTTADIWPPSGG